MKTFKAHDHVKWNTPQGETRGTVVKKVTSNTEYQGLTITASSDKPRYVVKSDSSGKLAAHTPDGLTAI